LLAIRNKKGQTWTLNETNGNPVNDDKIDSIFGRHEEVKSQEEILDVNFINVLRTAFMRADPKSVKKRAKFLRFRALQA